MDQIRKRKESEEIRPPWVVYPDTDPTWSGWRQGSCEYWLQEIWFPYWRELNEFERIEYVGRWQASSEWREHLVEHWSS